jgi:glucosamine-6-phosphate deaminase
MSEVLEFHVNEVLVRVFPDKRSLGETAALEAAAILRNAIEERGAARLVVATGNSQDEVIAGLVAQPRLDWSAVELFHMDEYVGLAAAAPGSLRSWLSKHLLAFVTPGRIHYLEGEGPDLEAECRRYGELLTGAPIDLTLVGIGENGHIAFNEPGQSDFADSAMVKRIRVDEQSRRQQAGEGHFASPEDVPREALTMTVPALMRSDCLIACVPERRKARAVRQAIEGGLTAACPGSIVFTHPRAFVYLDNDSASLLGRKS